VGAGAAAPAVRRPFVLAVPLFALIIEFIGWLNGDERYDELAHEFTKLLSVSFSLTATFGAFLLFMLVLLYPKFMNYLMHVFSPTFAPYVLLFFSRPSSSTRTTTAGEVLPRSRTCCSGSG
jgi:cytochrome bd-type quinol oxidase subunit 1